MTETPATKPRHLGIFDIGTNAVRFGVYEDHGNHHWTLIRKDHTFSELGRAHTDDTLHPDGVQKTIDALGRYCATLRNPQWNMIGVVAVATEAIRRAPNGPALINRIKSELDLTVHVIDGTEEARLGAKGVLSDIPRANGIVADLGGGSLQLTRVEGNHMGATISLPLGVQRLAEAKENCTHLIYQTLEDGDLPPPLTQTAHLYVIGGSLRTLARLYRGRAGMDGDEVGGMPLDPNKIQAMTEWLNTNPDAVVEAGNEFGIKYDRAKFLPQAALLLSSLIDYLEVRDITVSSAAIRDGLLQDFIDGRITPDPVPTLRSATPISSTPNLPHRP